MKKLYIAPAVEHHNYEFENLLVEVSNIEIGGTTDHFDTAKRSWEDNGEEDVNYWN